MSSYTMRKVRTAVRFSVYGWCVFAVFWSVVICYFVLINPFAGFEGESEFTALSGSAAKRRLPDWPTAVIPSDVDAVSFKSAYSRDGYSSWYCIKLRENAALTWSQQAHAHQVISSKQCLHERHEGLEGVSRTIDGPPSLHSQTGETPSWWSPRAIVFHATEVMLWYDGFNSGVGRATYTGFDDANQTLWIYDYACQHDILWLQGNVPSGDIFSTLDQANPQL